MAHDHAVPESSSARDLRQQAVALLAWTLPQPHNYITLGAFHFRKRRLETELAQFDYLSRLRLGRAATLAELVCAGTLLVAACKGRLPTRIMPLDDDLLINPSTFAMVRVWVEERLQAAGDGSPGTRHAPD